MRVGKPSSVEILPGSAPTGPCDVCWAWAPGRCVVRLVATGVVGTVVVCGACASSLYLGTPLPSPVPAELRQPPVALPPPRPPAPRQPPVALPPPRPPAPPASVANRWGWENGRTTCSRSHPWGARYRLTWGGLCPWCNNGNPALATEGPLEIRVVTPRPRPVRRLSVRTTAEQRRVLGLAEDGTPLYSLWPRPRAGCGYPGCPYLDGHRGKCLAKGREPSPVFLEYFSRGRRIGPALESSGDSDEWLEALYGSPGAVPHCLTVRT